MRSHAKAASAGSTEGSGRSRGLFRRALVTRGVSSEIEGTGARSQRLPFGLFATLLASVALLGVAAPAAGAATAIPSYGYFASFGGTAISSGLYNAVAVESSTGNIFINEEHGPDFEGHVSIYSADPVAGGVPLTSLATSPTVGEYTIPRSIAVDPADGSLYVADDASKSVFKLISDGAPVPTYTLDSSFSPPPGLFVGPGNSLGGIAVDPVTGDLLVAARRGGLPGLVYRLDGNGAIVSSNDGSSTSGGAFGIPASLAVGPTGTVYVADSGRVERFGPTGESLGRLPIPAGGAPSVIAANSQSGEVVVLVSRQGQSFLEGFTAAGQPTFSAVLPPQISGGSTGLAWDGDRNRIYLVTPNGTVHTFVPVIRPGVDAPVLSAISTTGVHVSAEVDPGSPLPEGSETHFEYILKSAYKANLAAGKDGFVGAAETPNQPLSGIETKEAEIGGLSPNVEYTVRAFAKNSLTSNVSGAVSFTTEGIPPETATDSATDVSETSATLNGRINPVGLPTTYYFEYGTSAAYGSRVPAGIEAVAGNGRQSRRLSRQVADLAPNTTYHFRLVAHNPSGTGEGADQTFRTAAAGSVPHRSYEQVTPVEKRGIQLFPIGFQAKADGSAIVYANENGSESSPPLARAMSRREGDDWNGGIELEPPLNLSGAIVSATTLGISADFTHTMAVTNRKLTPDAIEDGPERANLYVKDVATGTYTLIATAPSGLRAFIDERGTSQFFAGAPDFSWVVFRGPVPLLPGAPAGALYRWSKTDGLEVISNRPNGTPGAANVHSRAQRAVSADGSRAYFAIFNSVVPQPAEGLYLWEDGVPTKAISVSHVSGAPTAPHPARLFGISEDGRYAFFSADGTKLTDDAPDAREYEWPVYRYDASDESLEYLGADAFHNVFGVDDAAISLAVGDDGQTAYWLGINKSEEVGTFVWRDGSAERMTETLLTSSFSIAASPDGRYFAYANEGDVYLFDSETGDRSCASCLADGTPAGGSLTPTGTIVSNRSEQAVTDAGQVFFTSAARLIAADVNGAKDVYEYRDGKRKLISPGDTPDDAVFADISEDGSDVFFTTTQKLVGRDNDRSLDLYDARINGGLPKQSPPPPQECLRDDCKATPNAGPELPFGGSEALSGPGNVAGEARKRCAKGSHARKVGGKTRCVKRSKAKKKAKRANTNRRQGR